MKTLLTVLISVAVILVAFFLFYNFVPLSAFDVLSVNSPSFGTTVTTILGSDTLSASRTTINNNFTALNNGKIENSSTSIAAITTLANLTTVGTIISGTWTGTVIGVGYGGTGTTSPTTNMVILGNGSSGLKIVGQYGTTGQFLTSTGSSTPPKWQTSALDLNTTYDWLQLHTFAAGAIFNASTTFTSTTTHNLDVNITRNLDVNGNCYGCATSGFQVVNGSVFSGPTNKAATTSAWATCPAGKHAISGGGFAGNGQVALYASYASSTTGWSVDYVCWYGDTCSANSIFAQVVCVYE